MSIFALSKFLSVLTACHQRSAFVYQLDASGEASKTPLLSLRLYFRMARGRQLVPCSINSKDSYHKKERIFLHLVVKDCQKT